MIALCTVDTLLDDNDDDEIPKAKITMITGNHHKKPNSKTYVTHTHARTHAQTARAWHRFFFH